MAEKEYNDEYQFSELDALSPGESETSQIFGDNSKTEPTQKAPDGTVNLRRNILITIAVIIIIMVMYKFIGSYFAAKKTASTEIIPPAPTIPVQPSQVAQPVPAVQPTPSPVVVEPTMAKKMTDLESGQQVLRSEITSLNEQLNGLASHMSALTTQMGELNQMMTGLTARIEEKSREIEQLIARARSTPPPAKPRRKIVVQRVRYYIQAIIPGRAWLIGSNGTTLTVREGTVLPGYGVVKLIDPNQGRLLTSSGQVIRFSQEDS